MDQNSLTKQVDKKIREWSKGKSKLIVAIDGYTGVGKTTLLDNLAKTNPDILPVHKDDFLVSRSKLKKMLSKARDRSKIFELKVNDDKKIKKFLLSYRKNNKVFKGKFFNKITGRIDTPKRFDFSKKIMVIEGVFMFHPRLLNKLWDKKIYLQGDNKKIDIRRIKREKKRWGKNYFPETHPDSYFRQVIIALKRYNKKYKPQKCADLIADID